MDELLPECVAVQSARTDPPEAALLPEEEPFIAAAVPGRRAEFTTVRHLARLALSQIGHGPVAILPGPGRAPRWPVGYVGSLTHCAGFRAAAVARSSDLAGLGVDAEPNLPLPPGVHGMVLDDQERRHVAGLAERWPGPHWDRVIFSVKESVYKVWFPLTGRWLGFEAARVQLSPTDGSFTVRVHAADPGRLAQLTGRFAVTDGIIGTAVALPHE